MQYGVFASILLGICQLGIDVSATTIECYQCNYPDSKNPEVGEACLNATEELHNKSIFICPFYCLVVRTFNGITNKTTLARKCGAYVNSECTTSHSITTCQTLCAEDLCNIGDGTTKTPTIKLQPVKSTAVTCKMATLLMILVNAVASLVVAQGGM